MFGEDSKKTCRTAADSYYYTVQESKGPLEWWMRYLKHLSKSNAWLDALIQLKYLLEREMPA